jgi:phosphopantothenate synthetase
MENFNYVIDLLKMEMAKLTRMESILPEVLNKKFLNDNIKEIQEAIKILKRNKYTTKSMQK